MSEEKQPVLFTVFISVFPILLLLGVDIFTLFLQSQPKAISHLSFAFLTAQLLCLIVFSKGQICSGQRWRLSKVNLYFAIFWLVWFFLSVFSNYHFVLTDFVCIAGLSMVIATWIQPQDQQFRRSVLIMAAMIGGLGIVGYLLIFIDISALYFIQFSVFGQSLTGIILANLALVIARNRLQGFIALLPLGMLIMLFCNSLAALFVLFSESSSVKFANEFAFILYFILHLFMAFILAVHIFKRWTLSYISLSILLLISASLPVWSSFAYIA